MHFYLMIIVIGVLIMGLLQKFLSFRKYIEDVITKVELLRTLDSIFRTRNILLILVVLILLNLHMSFKINTRVAKYAATTKPNLRTKLPPASVNLKRINLFYFKKGDFFIPSSLKRRDWHNYTLMKIEKKKRGFGEQGQPAALAGGRKFLILKNVRKYGHNTALSDELSLKRSLPDTRQPDCKKRLYIESLPTVSMIVTFHEANLHTLLRSVKSALNRSPDHLMKEVILVDDGSTEEKLKKTLDKYVKENLPKVKVLRLRNRTGVVGARLAGAQLATADVLVFLDSDTEANINWLPPLLEPIALDYRTAVVPTLDHINYFDFEYQRIDWGMRGSFDWTLNYHRLPAIPKDASNLPEPFETPVMTGIFAISRNFFWELGGYDPGLKIWGGEQFELSFKIWQCGGRILEAPCSRIGHIFTDQKYYTIDDGGEKDYLARNYRRIAEVWMDDYANYLYKRKPECITVEPGDLAEQRALRRKLKCKPFRWFITQIAFDLRQQFLPKEPQPYAEGRIRPKLNYLLCVDANHGKNSDLVQLNLCYKDNVDPKENDQYWKFTWYNDIRLRSRNMCMDVPDLFPGCHVIIFECHRKGGSQQWKYNVVTRQLEFFDGSCLDHNPKNRDLFLNHCDNRSTTQVWRFDIVNKSQLKKWNETHNIRVTGPEEQWTE